MTLRPALVPRFLLACLALACNSGTRSDAPKPTAARPEPVIGPALGPGRCTLDVTRFAPPRKRGRAQVRMSGSGGTIVGRDVPALCGPLYDRDWEAIGKRAGEGVLFETCLPEGLFQLSSEQRVEGSQTLHGSGQIEGTAFAFNQNNGPTFTLRGAATDRVTLRTEPWHAEVSGVLMDENDKRSLSGTVTFDCAP